MAVASVPLSQPLLLISDSKYAIDGLTTHLTNWEDQGWIGISNTPFFKRAAYLLRRRTAPTAFKWVKGHDGIKGNEKCDALTKEGAAKPTPDVLDLDIPNNFNIQEAKLATLTQATAYKGIIENTTPPPRQSSSENVQRARTAIERYSGNDETDAAIWMSIRKSSIRPKITQFLFKTMHNTFKIGTFWSCVQDPDIAECQFCKICDVTESMAHILIRC